MLVKRGNIVLAKREHTVSLKEGITCMVVKRWEHCMVLDYRRGDTVLVKRWEHCMVLDYRRGNTVLVKRWEHCMVLDYRRGNTVLAKRR